ncbi:MAG: hypothetical protein JOS17DRAFT_841259 [Linnemannia elongata]|nr:MAG: hypothetical protein JOS17DRAFT_841259 [Linnemannia elongata]
MEPPNTPPPSRQKKRPFESTSISITASSSPSTTLTPERTRVTQACDRCRQKKTVCDALRPACSRCLRANHECTFLMPQKKRGPLHGSKQGVTSELSNTVGQLGSSTNITTSTTDTTLSDQNARLRQSWEAHVQELEQRTWPDPSSDHFSKEVQDHLVEVFFEFCFEDFNCFSPARFLKSYSQGTLNPDLLNAVCAVAARFSNHPAVVTAPPCMSGEPFASKIRSRMGALVVEVSIDIVHTLVLLGFYEYISGNPLRGYRLEGIAGRMASELELHKAFAQKMTGPFDSEEVRVTTETKVRTFALLLGTDAANSAVAGIPPLFDSTQFEPWIVSFEADWWVEPASERQIGTQREEQALDPAYVLILRKALRPRPIRGFGDPSLTVPILLVGISVWRFTNTGVVPETVSVQSSSTSSRSSPSSPTAHISPLASPTTPTAQQRDKTLTSRHWRESIPVVQRLDAAAEAWRRLLPEDFIPTSAKFSVWRTDVNIIHHTLYYYLLRISLYRPTLLKAGMAADRSQERKKELSKQGGVTGKSESIINVGFDTDTPGIDKSDPDKDVEAEDQRFLRMALEICSDSANQITAIVEHFTERLVRIRGSHLSFPIFIAGTAHVLQLTTSKDPTRVAQAKQGLLTCIRFFRILGPYWTAANDQAMLLEGLLNAYTAKAEQKLSSSTSPKHVCGGDNNNEGEQPNQVISAALVLLEMNTPGAAQQFSMGTPDTTPSLGTSVPTTTDTVTSSSPSSRSSISAKSASTTTRFRSESEEPEEGSESAFLITDAGLGTIWREPEKLEALEKATLLSLERLSFLN